MKRNRVGEKKSTATSAAGAQGVQPGTSAKILKPGTKTTKTSKRTQKVRWTQEEDNRLQRTVLDYLKETNTDSGDGSISWKIIAERLTGRSGKQCRERWSNHVNPNIKTDPWTEEEEILIVKLQREKGNSWKDISQFLEGRSDNAIKNHWHSMRRRKHRLIVESHLALGGGGSSAASAAAGTAAQSSGRVLVPSKSSTSKKSTKGGKSGKATGRSGSAKTSAFIKAAGTTKGKKAPKISRGKKAVGKKGPASKASSSGDSRRNSNSNHTFGSGSGTGASKEMHTPLHMSSSKENLNAAFQSIDSGRGLSKSHDIFLMDNISPPPYMPTASKMFLEGTPLASMEIVQSLKHTGGSGGGAATTTPNAESKRLSNMSFHSSMGPHSISSLSTDGIMHNMLNMSEMSSTRLTPELARSMNFDDITMPNGDSVVRTPPMISPLTLRNDSNGAYEHG
eukprot:INCI904.2.p1 GENE.INCI904.2~~INCI904.2.p1  ORF type:complete len:451 (-),score=85.88 INCI904.2:92-1444(-)